MVCIWPKSEKEIKEKVIVSKFFPDVNWWKTVLNYCDLTFYCIGFIWLRDIYIIIERIDRRRSVVYPVPYYRS